MPSRLHDFEIHSPGTRHFGKIVMDGVELQGVTHVNVDIAVDRPAIVSLDFVPGSVKVTGEGTLDISGRER